MAEFIGKENLELIATKYAPEIAMGAANFRPEVFDHMRIKVISGIQFKEVKTLMNRKGHTTRRKVVGDIVANTAGYLEERTLTLSLAWNRYKDNKDNYMETAVVVYDNDSAINTYPLSELALQAAVANYGEDLFDCLWHGDTTIDKDAENGYLSLFDGFYTNLLIDRENGRISAEMENFVALEDTIEYPEDDTDTDAWEVVYKFHKNWSTNLRNAREVLIYCTDETGAAIAAAYENKHGHHFTVRYDEMGNFKVAEWRNVTFCPDSSMGEGDLLIATVPDNFEYGVNSLDSKTKISVQVGSDTDADDIFFQVQSAQGTRVFNVNPGKFCMSDGSLIPVGIAGDYTKSFFIVSANDSTYGSVTVNGSASEDKDYDYPAGTSLALVATANEGYDFVKWSDGNTSASRTVVTTNKPSALVAIFEASEEGDD